ncbi:MAG: putative glycoside hydrolase [Candidatus Krumholzibacteriota bacterium]
MRIAALDYQVGDLTDPAELAKYTRADILIVQPDQFWGRPDLDGRLASLRAAKPDLKIIAYFRSKVTKTAWGVNPRESHTYIYDLYHAAKPYWCRTTTGDTLMDWPGAVVFDYTNPEARRAMLDVFVSHQQASSNKFDGVFWDYFNDWLWIAPAVTDMEGEPDMDGDGVPHMEDEDELQAFQDAQYDWAHEMQAAMGPDFIQIANGYRALTDSLFAAEFDGMFYELFPNVGFSSGETFRRALDLNQYNNLFTARTWPRRTNGGPWLILSHSKLVGSIRNEDGGWDTIDPGNLLRAVALLTGATSTHYALTGQPRAGIPAVELDLGRPLGETVINGDLYMRDFERGRVELLMGAGQYPIPFSYVIPENGVVIEQFGEIPATP